MKKYWIRYIVLFIGIIVAVGTFYEELYDIMVSLRQVPVYSLIGMIICTQIYYVIDGTITKRMVSHEKSITYRQGIACTYYCAFFRVVTLGSGSGIAQVVYLAKCGIDAAKSSSIAMIQYVLQKFTIVLLGVVSYIVFYKKLCILLGKYSIFVFIGVIVAFGIISIILMVACSKKFSDKVIYLLRNIGTKRIKDKFKGKIDELEQKATLLQNESRELFAKKNLFIVVIITNIVKLICMFLAPYMFIHNEINVVYAVAIFAVSHMLAGVMVAPSGYGTLDFMFVLLYGPIVGSIKVAQIIVLYRLANTIVSYIVGAFVYMLSFKKNGERMDIRKLNVEYNNRDMDNNVCNT